LGGVGLELPTREVIRDTNGVSDIMSPTPWPEVAAWLADQPIQA